MVVEKWAEQTNNSSATEVDYVITTPTKIKEDFRFSPIDWIFSEAPSLGYVFIPPARVSRGSSEEEETSQEIYDPSMWLSNLRHMRKDLIELPEIIRSTSMPADPIKTATLLTANQFITRFVNIMTRYEQVYTPPHVSTEGKGEVSFEWWRNEKILTFIVETDGEITCLKVWGVDIWEEMEETSNPTDNELIDLWRWLNA